MESSISKSIARKLRQARKATGYTQEEVADKLGIARSAYGHIESGRNLISVEHLQSDIGFNFVTFFKV